MPKRIWVAELDAAAVQHDGQCHNCGVQIPVPMSRTRLERRPWRMVWWCHVCGRLSRKTCSDELVSLLEDWDRPGGTVLSMREVADFVSVDLDGLNRAVLDELL